MAQVISAEEGALRRGAQAVNEAKAGIDQQVRKVRGEIDQLRGFWQGGAAVAFTGLMTRWDEQATKLNDVLVTLEAALSGTEKDQAATEEQHSQTISGLGSMMSGI
ncbi:MAG: WXG100 family type VII secretion target [Cryobacterium sp.]|nr:WXG100 family type VII secretion target [Cryobacterium sp.]